MNEDLLKRIEDLENFKKNLEASYSIPLNIDQAFRARFGGTGVTVSAHTGETKQVNEGGVAVYNVMTAPDGFLQIQIGGTIYYIPMFT